MMSDFPVAPQVWASSHCISSDMLSGIHDSSLNTQLYTQIHLTDTWTFLFYSSENSWLAETQRGLETDKTKAPEGYGYLPTVHKWIDYAQTQTMNHVDMHLLDCRILFLGLI